MFMDVHDDELQLDSWLWRFITCMPALRLQLVQWCNNQAWVQSDKEIDADAAARRGNDALVSQVLTHLLRSLPLSVGGDTNPRMGIAERVQQLQEAMSGHDIGVVGLHGMGGIGKSTLARAFFAEQAKLPVFKRRVLLHVGQEATGDMLHTR